MDNETLDITEQIPFDIPSQWSWVRLKGVCTIYTGATFKKEEAKQDNKGIRVLRGGNILPFQLQLKPDDIYISKEKVKSNILLKSGDIVTPAVTSLENIGKMARVEEDMQNVTVGGFVFIIRPFYVNTFSQYLLYFMSSPTAIEYMKSITNKSGQAFYNIGKERLATTLIPIPPLCEQERICRQIENVFSKIKG
ncbi:restriction endonuclease subunit S [uncultured Prevotella sp.]|uniref:restriction endonuclease subunit S n=1 Tax=uncultured Prevotella sp. TaxID=159272 RepID=UPI00280553D6|nr:restriction endonuclease subunit S [uncultured Prevotella sp.]